MGKIANFRASIGDMISRAALATRAGITFGGKRDLYGALGYKEKLEFGDFRSRYARNDIAGALVDAKPNATWRGGAEVIETDDVDNVTAFEAEFAAFSERVRLWPLFCRADRLAGLGNYATLLIGAPDEFEKEMPKGDGTTSKIGFLAVYPQSDLKVKTLVTDGNDPRFGQPEFYELAKSRTGKSVAQPVHWSRVLHIADNQLDSETDGVPRLERPWNNIDNLEKVTGGGAEAFWLRAHQGYQFDLDPEIELSPEEATKLSDEVDEFTNGMRRAVRTRGVKMTPHGSDVADFSPQADAILTQLAGGSNIPKRILTGSESGELASSQDRNNWNEVIRDRRSTFASPFVVRPFVDRLLAYNYLPEPKQYWVRWPEIKNLGEIEQSQVAERWANVNKAYSDGGQNVIEPDEIREHVLGLTPLDMDSTSRAPVTREPGDVIAASRKKKLHTPR